MAVTGAMPGSSYRPPAYTGSTLGGLWRLLGFPSYRFNDKAGIYFAVQDAVVATKDKKNHVRLHQAVNLTAA